MMALFNEASAYLYLLAGLSYCNDNRVMGLALVSTILAFQLPPVPSAGLQTDC